MLHVCPEGFGGNNFISKKVLQLNGAGKHAIANFGQGNCEFITDSTVRGVNKLVGLSCVFQVCRVSEPILSTYQLASQGWTTVLRDRSSFMRHRPTGVCVPLVREQRSWYLYSHTLYTYNAKGVRAIVEAVESSVSSHTLPPSSSSPAGGVRRRLNRKTNPAELFSSSSSVMPSDGAVLFIA